MTARFVALALVLAGAAHAAELPDCATKGTWTRYDGEHVILYTNAPAEIGLRDARRFESFAWMFDRRSPSLRKRGAPRVTAIGFASKGDYAPFRPVFEGKPVESIGFFLSGPLGKTLEFVTSERPQEARVIYHEYQHSLVHDMIGHAPPWIAEGMADFYSTFALVGDRAYFGHPIPELGWVLEHEEPLTIAQLTGMGHGHDYYQGGRRDMMYAESWALVHYLVHGYSSAVLEKAALRLSAGETPDVVLAQAYPKEDWATLPARLKSYANPDEMDKFDIPLGGTYTEPVIPSRAVDRAEILNVLGDVMVQNERFASTEAPAYYRAALAARPEDPEAVRGLALVNELRKFPKEAIPLYERAAAGASAAASTLGQCAEGVMRSASLDTAADSTTRLLRLAKARGIAIKALALEPLEPRSLGVLTTLGDGDSAAAVEVMPALEKAHEQDPKNAAVTGGLVRAYARAGLDPAAEALYADEALRADETEYERTSDVIERRMLDRAHDAMRAGRAAEGKAILERMRATTRNVDFAAFLDKEIARVSEFQAKNRWVDRYNDGIRAVQDNKLDDALVIFEDVRVHANEEHLIFEAGKRVEEIRAFKKARGR
jgi:hypothetical protein